MKILRFIIIAAVFSLAGCGGWDMPWEEWPPSEPQSLSVQAVATSQIEVTWEASRFRAKGYRVYRDGVVYVELPSTGLMDSGLAPAERHCYAVTAYNGGGESSPTPALCDTTFPHEDQSPPTAPESLAAAAASATRIDLSWEAATDDIAVARYNIYRNGEMIGSTPSLSFGDTGLTASTEYCYNVSAVDKAGNEGQGSNAACATTTSE